VSLRIVALPAGTIRNFPQAAVTYHRGWTQTHDVPQIMFAILGGAHPIMVDTGTPPPEFVREHHGYDFVRSEAEDPLTQLGNAGVDPADVRDVAYTHLHWDHCGNPELFGNATFHIQAEEILYAIDPAEVHRPAFECSATIRPPWASVLGRIHTLRGEYRIAPGVTAIPLPGHTPGSQGVLVETDGGRYLLAGDCVDTYRNWTGDGVVSHIPSGSFTNMLDYMDSFRRMESLDCEVVPSHDPAVLERGVLE